MVDIAAQGEESLKRIGYVRFNLLRRHPGIKRRHHYNRDIDLREQVNRHAHHGGHADDRNDQAQHDDEIRIRQGKLWHYFASASPGRLVSIAFGATFIPERNSFRLPTTTRSPSLSPARTSTLMLPCKPNCTLRSSRTF